MMASVFSLNNLSLHFSEKPLLDNVSLTISDGDKIGIVGRNGAGKSSLLRLLAGLDQPDNGSLTTRTNLTISYLPQTPSFPKGITITEAALLCCAKGHSEEDSAAAFEAQTLLTQLGFKDLKQSVDTLSGGQKMRVAIAGALCRECDVLLMDEPTNHIDLEMAQWLENRLASFRGTLLVVTHDRYLLGRVFNRIFHVGLGKVDTYQTNYAGYLEERAQREEIEAATLRKNRSLYRKELAWIQRGAQARSTKAKGRIERFEALSGKIQDKPTEETVALKSVASRLGRKIMSWEHLCVGYDGTPLCDDFTYTLLRDDRMGIVGSNGEGKTTLLKTLCGEIPPVSGIIEKGDTVKIGYFSQHCPPIPEDMRVIDAVQDIAVKVYTPDGDLSASQMAETFLFHKEMQYQKVASLSGGEQRRLYLLRILMAAPNVLILDEPTNDLDIETLNVLEDYIDSFQGAVIAVSHDRFFLDRITTHLFGFRGGKLVPYIGGYQSFLDDLEADRMAAEPVVKKAVVKEAPKTSAPRFSFKEQRDFDTIEDTMASLEEKLAQLEKDIEANASSYTKVAELMEEQTKTAAQLDEAMERWMYLQEKAEEIRLYKEQKK
ncbi:MAG: ABC-F family ATP-binding cassette domain-containing protein [Clostridia bacterium]|nr:ABC-F family ATP-binding cassette domain-containing protein [Clostridia bacterium]